MKSAIVYYSLEGNTDYAAKMLAKEMKADLLKVEPVKEYPSGKVTKYFWAGKSTVFGETPKLVTYQFDAEKYDMIVLATPVWAGNFAAPLRTFLRENDLKNHQIGMVACCDADEGKCFQKLENEIGECNIKGTLVIKNRYVHKEKEEINSIQEFAQKLFK